jgi:hypothetical protein
MAHFTFLVISHLKMIVCQNFNLPHNYMVIALEKSICDMIIIKLFKLILIIYNDNV